MQVKGSTQDKQNVRLCCNWQVVAPDTQTKCQVKWPYLHSGFEV